MSHEDWPHLQETEIQALATAKVFARGRALFDEGALENLTRQGEKLSALCPGSEGEDYELSALVKEQGVQKTRCSCPYEYEGICKHLVALLLAWAHTPEVFHEAGNSETHQTGSALLQELQGRESGVLAQLIVQLVETEPKLRAVVRRLLQDRLSAEEVEKTERAVTAIILKFARADYESDASGARTELLFHVRAAASLEPQRPHDALRLYLAVLKGMMAAGENLWSWDEDSQLSGVSQQCLDALPPLLLHASGELQVECLKVVCQAYLFDIQMGGYGFAEGADAILENTGAEEWQSIEPQLDAYLKHKSKPQFSVLDFDELGWDGKGRFPLSDWGRESIIGLKARRIERLEGKRAGNDLLIEQGTPQQQIYAHLANSNFDKAIQLAHRHFAKHAGFMRSIADKLNEVGQWPLARDWAVQNELTAWLAHHSALRGEPDALQLNIAFFRDEPTTEQWSQVMRLVSEDSRGALKAELWKHLEKKAVFVTMFDIRLGEGDVTGALEIWPRLNSWQKQERHERLAIAAEKSGAGEVAAGEVALVMVEFAEASISRKGRDAYRIAANALRRAKKLLEKAGRGSEWPGIIGPLRARYKSLRALKEELDRAKL